MKLTLKSLRLLAPFVLALVLVCGFAYFVPGRALRQARAAGAAPLGSYSYLVTSTSGVAILGVLNFDGVGNLSGTYTSGDPQGTGGSGALSGNYTVNVNGSGTMSFAFDNGVGVQSVYATNNGGSGIQLLFTGGAPGLRGNALRQ